MKKLIITASIFIGLYFLYQSYPFGSFNYRLTLVIETPEGKIVGSSVRKVSVFTEPKIFPEQHSSHSEVKGEAVVVDLGKRGVLFALLSKENDNDYGDRIAFQEFPQLGGMKPEAIKNYPNIKAKNNLSFDKLPMLVHFRDINDPKTAKKVDPNHLEKSFGKGVKLVSATIEITDDEVTTGVEKRLPWISNYYNKLFDGNRYEKIESSDRFANSIGAGDFSAGMGLSQH